MINLGDGSHFRPAAVRDEADVPLQMPTHEQSASRVLFKVPERSVEARTGDRIFQIELAVRDIIGVTLLELD